MKRERLHQQTLVEHHLVLYEVKVEAKKYSYKISGCVASLFLRFACVIIDDDGKKAIRRTT